MNCIRHTFALGTDQTPTRRIPLLLRCALFVAVISSLGLGPASTAVQKIREGIRFFQNGDFEQAGKAFTEADVSQPENATIAFDRACVLAASGETEKARELYRTAALARNGEIAMQSHFNLGCLSAEEARTIIGDQPAETPADQRQSAISLLITAVGHYRDCLKIEPSHFDARHNLELIRLFIKHVQALWEQQDRDKARDEMGLLEFLAMIEQRQSTLRSMTREIENEADSPQRRQLVQETADSQRTLREEIEPLKGKINEQFQTPQQGQSAPGQTPPPADPAASQNQMAQKLLQGLADEAGNLMNHAADELESEGFDSAADKQKETLDRLNQIFMAAAPFTNVLQRATERQQTQVDRSEGILGPETTGDDDNSPDAEAATTSSDDEPESTDERKQLKADYLELAWEQERITDWSRMLKLKAEVEQKALAAQEQALAQSPPQDPGGNPPGGEPSAEDQAAQLEAMKQSLEKAIELGPTVQKHSETATEHLKDELSREALPEQREALRVLKEIAEPLAQQNQQQDDQQQNDQKDQQKQDQSQQQQDQQQQNSQPQQSRSPQEQAESVLRRAREREREHRDLQKKIRQLLGGRVRVDRDW